MKKLSLCMLAAAFLFTSCNFFVTPEDSKKDKEDVKPELPAPTDFEYTAENDVPADQSPFDEKLCNKTADSLELSDGDWTIVEINQSFLTYSKIIAKVGVTDGNLTYKSGIVKLDVESESIDEEDDTPVYYDESNLKTSFDTIKNHYLAPISDYSTFSNGYLIGDDKIVYIASIKLDSLKSYFESKIKDKAIKSNTAKNKYFIEAEGPHIFPSFIYIYRDANLNDEELNSETPEVTQPEITNPENSEEPQNPPAESEEPSENQNKPETDLKKIYTAKNDVPATQAPFDESSCPFTGKAPVFSNGNWKIVDIAKGTIYNTKVITDVSYTDNNYNCSSIVCKYDFPREGASEVDYKELYKEKILPYDKYDDGLSHGYLTDNKIVLIAKNKTSEFKEIYLAQLSAVSEYSQYINSNKEGTKYIIPYNDNGYLQTIYIYKEPLEDDTEADDDLGYTAPTLPASVGTDPFKGKTFGNTTEKYEFGNDNTITYYGDLSNQPSSESDVQAQFKYQYTYDADTKLLTYRCVMMLDPTTEKLATFNEIKANLSKLTSGDQNPEELYDYYVSSLTELFETPKVWKAELSEGNLSVYDPYYTEVPDLTKTNLQLRNSFNNTTVEILVTQYDKSYITIVLPVNRTNENGGLTINYSSIKTEYEITSLKENTITAIEKNKMERNNAENGDYYSVVNPTPATITIEYKNAKAKDGLIYIDISGKDDITKQALGADEETPDPSYTVISTNDQPHTYPLMN